MDLDLAWEFAPEGEFAFAELAVDYFQAHPTLAQQAAALLALFEAPHYFRRAGKGRFKKAPAEIVQQALAAIEKKKAVQAQIAEWSAQLAEGVCPPAGPRAALQASSSGPTRTPPSTRPWSKPRARRNDRRSRCCKQAGAIDSPYQFHWKPLPARKLSQGHRLPAAAPRPPSPTTCRSRTCRLFRSTIRSTTEIDDALSVAGLGTGTVHGGHPHRGARPGDLAPAQPARPGGARPPVDGLHAGPQDHHAARRRGANLHPARRARLPGRLALRQLRRSLAGTQEHRDASSSACPSPPTCATTQLDGARHRRPGSKMPRWTRENTPEVAKRARAPLSFLFRLAKQLKAQREVVRGKPESFNRPDYNFRLIGNDGEHPPAMSRCRSAPASAARRWT
jgi:exoribonuclease-2